MPELLEEPVAIFPAILMGGEDLLELVEHEQAAAVRRGGVDRFCQRGEVVDAVEARLAGTRIVVATKREKKSGPSPQPVGSSWSPSPKRTIGNTSKSRLVRAGSTPAWSSEVLPVPDTA